MENYCTIVADKEYNEIGNIINNYCNMLNSIIIEYQATLSWLRASGIQDGQSEKALGVFISYVYKLENVLPDIGEKFNTMCRNFISDVDQADEYLYEASSGKNIVRDFSDHEYQELLKLVDDSHESSNFFVKLFDHIDDNRIGFFIKWLGWYDVKKEVGDALRRTQSTLMDYNNDSKKFLKSVFDNVHNIDLKYGRSIMNLGSGDNYRSSYANVACSSLSAISNIIAKLKEIMGNYQLMSSEDNIVMELDPLYDTFDKLCAEISLLDTSETLPSEEMIKSFCQNYNNETFFYAYAVPFHDIISNIDVGSIASIVIFQGESITLEKLAKIFSIPSGLEKGDYYAYLTTKKELAEHLEKMTNTTINISEQKNLEKTKEVISAIRGNKEDYPNYKKYKKTYDQVDNLLKKTSKLIGVGINTEEIFLRIFQDYTQNIEIIESIENQVDKNSLTGIALKSLKKEYENKYLSSTQAMLEYVWEEVSKEGVNDVENEVIKRVVAKYVGKSAAKKTGKAMDFVLFARNVVGDLSGLSITSSEETKLSIGYSHISDLNQAYRKAFEKVKNGDTSEEAISSLSNSFELLKRGMITEYESAIQIASTQKQYDKKLYYQYCKLQIANAKLNQDGIPKLMTFDEYNKYRK